MGTGLKKKKKDLDKAVMGFTIVEIMAVLALFLILSAGAVTLFTRTMASYRLQQTADQMAWEIRTQQQEAIAYGSARQMEFFLFGNYYQIMEPEYRNVFLLPGIEYVYISFPPTGYRSLLKFNASGCPDRGGTIALKNKYGKHRYVIISPVVGRIRISEVRPAN
ncbi:MAG: hypothetical protein GX295_02820 [Syntrophomonadaceae bacterium]|nr:hypothetical protein [Syntrophomonadaceae bacterium]